MVCTRARANVVRLTALGGCVSPTVEEVGAIVVQLNRHINALATSLPGARVGLAVGRAVGCAVYMSARNS